MRSKSFRIRFKAIKRLFDKAVLYQSRKTIADQKKHYETLMASIKNTHADTIKTISSNADERVSNMETLTETQIDKLEITHRHEIDSLNRFNEKTKTELKEKAKRFSVSNEIHLDIDELYDNHVFDLYDELERRRKASEELIGILIRSNSNVDEMTSQFKKDLSGLRKKLSSKLNVNELNKEI